jgi:hypothetical protein
MIPKKPAPDVIRGGSNATALVRTIAAIGRLAVAAFAAPRVPSWLGLSFEALEAHLVVFSNG